LPQKQAFIWYILKWEKDVVSENCIYSLFATGIHSRDYINFGIDGFDLIITVGYNIVEYPPDLWDEN
jgi:acetolactate synthase-1/2/3 large subunit